VQHGHMEERGARLPEENGYEQGTRIGKRTTADPK
jgi:hypothetical protein